MPTGGQEFRTPAAAGGALSGRVERPGSEQRPQALLVLEEPSPGIASINAFAMGGQVHIGFSVMFYGEGGATVVEREQPKWQALLAQLFPVGAG